MNINITEDKKVDMEIREQFLEAIKVFVINID